MTTEEKPVLGMTPGQAVYEARITARRTRLLCSGETALPEPPAWVHLDHGQRADEEAAARVITGRLVAGAARYKTERDQLQVGIARFATESAGLAEALTEARAELADVRDRADFYEAERDRERLAAEHHRAAYTEIEAVLAELSGGSTEPVLLQAAHLVAKHRDHAASVSVKLGRVRELAESWTKRAPAERTMTQAFTSSPRDMVSADCGREILALLAEVPPGVPEAAGGATGGTGESDGLPEAPVVAHGTGSER